MSEVAQLKESMRHDVELRREVTRLRRAGKSWREIVQRFTKDFTR